MPTKYRRCKQCAYKLAYARNCHCPKCGTWDRRLFVADHKEPHRAALMTDDEIVREYREADEAPPVELLRRVERREVIAL
jgi:hypothetical protein